MEKVNNPWHTYYTSAAVKSLNSVARDPRSNPRAGIIFLIFYISLLVLKKKTNSDNQYHCRFIPINVCFLKPIVMCIYIKNFFYILNK